MSQSVPRSSQELRKVYDGRLRRRLLRQVVGALVVVVCLAGGFYLSFVLAGVRVTLGKDEGRSLARMSEAALTASARWLAGSAVPEELPPFPNDEPALPPTQRVASPAPVPSVPPPPPPPAFRLDGLVASGERDGVAMIVLGSQQWVAERGTQVAGWTVTRIEVGGVWLENGGRIIFLEWKAGER